MKKIEGKNYYFEENINSWDGLCNELCKSANNIKNSVKLEFYNDKLELFLSLKLKMAVKTFNKLLNSSNNLLSSTLKTCVRVFKADHKYIYSDNLINYLNDLNISLEDYRKMNSEEEHEILMKYITERCKNEIEKIINKGEISLTDLSRFYLGIEPRIYENSIKNYTKGSTIRISLFIKIMNFINEEIKIM